MNKQIPVYPQQAGPFPEILIKKEEKYPGRQESGNGNKAERQRQESGKIEPGITKKHIGEEKQGKGTGYQGDEREGIPVFVFLTTAADCPFHNSLFFTVIDENQ